MFKITADGEKNRLDIFLTDQIDRDAAASARQALIDEVNKLKPGFAVVNDISELQFGHLPAFEILKDIIIFLKERQAGKIIRVIGKSRIGKAQFEYATQNIAGYDVIIVESLEDARQHLDN